MYYTKGFSSNVYALILFIVGNMNVLLTAIASKQNNKEPSKASATAVVVGNSTKIIQVRESNYGKAGFNLINLNNLGIISDRSEKMLWTIIV